MKQPNLPSPITVTVETTSQKLPDWDGWSDGEWTRLFNITEFEALDQLPVHWSTCILGGDKKGDPNASTAAGGKLTRRQCMGIIHCENPECSIIIRPQTRLAGIEKQLSQSCQCSWTLKHVTCEVISTLHRYKEGVLYANGGIHMHQQPTHVLHLLPNEKAQLHQIFNENPKIGALKLTVGLPSFNGPGKSVADISPALLNPDQVRHEKKKAKFLYQSNGESTLDQLTAFEE
jgi:hypothetical protein